MNDDAKYVLDANVFIEAARRYYAFDLVPTFWTLLIEEADRGRIESIDRVEQELAKGKDELADWAKDSFGHAFASTDEAEIFTTYKTIMAWVTAQEQFQDGAKSSFADGADGWLVAYALVAGFVVVTQEVVRPDARNRIPIPNVCQAFNVRFVDTFEMLRQLGRRIA